MRTYALERDIERLQSRLTSVEEDYADAEKSLEAVRADLRAAEGRVEELEAKLLAAEKAREAWTETARMHAKNEAYYRDLIVRTLSGTPAAFVSDDGSVQQDVICAKLPELYAAAEKAREKAERERDEARASEEWLAFARMREERDALKAERNAALTLAENRGAAYDMTWREVESLRDRLDKEEEERGRQFGLRVQAEAEVERLAGLVEEWLDGNARLGRPKSIADQRFLNGLNAAIRPTFSHWSGTATKPEE